MFTPVGVGDGCVKIAPPLCINEEALEKGCSIIHKAIAAGMCNKYYRTKGLKSEILSCIIVEDAGLADAIMSL